MKKIGELVCKNKILIIIITCLLLIPALIGMYKTKINYDILVYLPEDIETMKGQEILAKDFNMGAFSTIVVEKMNSYDVLKLEEKIKSIKGVEKVVSITDLTGTTIPREILPSEIVNKVSKGDSQLVLVTFKNSTSSEETLDAVDEIRNITNETTKVGGMSAMVLDTMNLSNQEIIAYVIIAVILCIIVLMLALDSYLAPFLLLGNIGIAILFNMGTNIFLGNISYITKAISSVLQLGVTTDFSIFLYHKYETAKTKTKDKDKAMSEAICETLVSVLGSSLTTIAGFLALCTMNLTLGRDIGIVMAKGVLMGLLCVVTLFPSLLLIFDKQLSKKTHKPFIPKFKHLKNFTLKHYKLIFIIFLILILPAWYGNKNVNVYYNLDKSLPDNLPSSVANTTLKEEYNIVSPEIVLVNNDINNDDINKMINEIKALDGIEVVLSASELANLGIPDEIIDEDVKSIFKSKQYQMIFINSIYGTATNELNDQIDKVSKIVKSYDKNALVAGEGALMKDLVEISDQDFHNVNYTSIAVILIIMLLVLKSVSLPVLLVCGIEFAIFINMAVPYYMNTTIPFIASIVIGTIQLGATIDYAILMTTKYMEERKNGKDKEKAMMVALDNSVNSIFVSGLCFFAATFGVGIYSKLEMIGSICTLIARGAIVSMFVVIMILPSILLIFDGLITRTTLGFKRRNNMKKISTILLATSLLISSVPVSALTKNETVYSKLNNDGSIKNIIVSEYLKNTDNQISDETNLKNILNLNGTEKYKLEGTNIVWDANGKDIYYQGEIDKELPISLNMSYKLDGKDITLKDLLGKKGHVELKLKYTNKEVHDININGKQEKLYTPFIVTLGTIISNDNNSNIEVTNGKVVSNGKNSIVIAMASPGLYESLNMDSFKNFDTITLSFDTNSFELSSIYSVVSSNLINSDNLESFDKLDTIYSKVDTLSNSSKQLVNGSSELLNGSKKLSEGVSSLSNGLNQAYSGSKKLNDTLSTKISESENMTAIDDNTLTFIKDKAISEVEKNFETKQLQIAEAALSEVVQNKDNIEASALSGLLENETYATYKEAVKTAEANGIAELIAMCQNNPTAICLDEDNIKNMTNYKNAKTVVTIMEETAKTVAYKTAQTVAQSTSTKVAKEAAIETTSQVSVSVAKEVAASAQNKTISSLKELNQNINTLTNGLNQLNNGSKELLNGTNSLTNGMDTLTNGLSKFDKEGIDSISNFVNGDVKTLEEKMKALVKLGDAYDTFTMKKDNTDGETKFVLMIDAEKKEAIKKNKTTKSSKKESLVDKIKNIFTK